MPFHNCTFPRQVLLALAVLLTSQLFGSARDSTITSYWRNRNKQIETVYKIKYIKNNSGQKVATLGKVKKLRYYDQAEGKEISKDDYYSVYSFTNRIDSLEHKFTKHASTAPMQYITMNFGENSLQKQLPIKIPIKSSASKIYKESDTLLQGNVYAVQLYRRDTIRSNQEFTGALRSEAFKVYYFDSSKGTEELIVDFTLYGNEMAKTLSNGSAVLITSTSEISVALKKELGEAVTNTLSQGLVKLFLLLGKP